MLMAPVGLSSLCLWQITALHQVQWKGSRVRCEPQTWGLLNPFLLHCGSEHPLQTEHPL